MFKRASEDILIKPSNAGQYNPSVISANNGDFAVTWAHKGQGSKDHGIYVQKYSDITAGSYFQVDTSTDERMHSKSNYLKNGNLVVVWCSDKKDGSGYGVYASIYDSSNTLVKEDFRINTETKSNQEYPSIAALENGDFVIVWQSLGQDAPGITSGVYGQRYSADGSPKGEEFRVNNYVADNQERPTITSLKDGGFVVVWQSFGQDASGHGVFAQQYNSQGVVTKGEYQINTYTKGNQENPVVTALENGDFVVAWQSFKQDGSGHGIFAQRYNSQGIAMGEEFQVNSYSTNSQKNPSITGTADGFVIAWQSDKQDGDGYGIYAKSFDNNGNVLEEEFRVNTYTKGNQENPSAIGLSDGNYTIVWQSFGQNGYNYATYAQIYTKTEILNTETTKSSDTNSVDGHQEGAVLTTATNQQSGSATTAQQFNTQVVLSSSTESPTTNGQPAPVQQNTESSNDNSAGDYQEGSMLATTTQQFNTQVVLSSSTESPTTNGQPAPVQQNSPTEGTGDANAVGGGNSTAGDTNDADSPAWVPVVGVVVSLIVAIPAVWWGYKKYQEWQKHKASIEEITETKNDPYAEKSHNNAESDSDSELKEVQSPGGSPYASSLQSPNQSPDKCTPVEENSPDGLGYLEVSNPLGAFSAPEGAFNTPDGRGAELMGAPVVPQPDVETTLG